MKVVNQVSSRLLLDLAPAHGRVEPYGICQTVDGGAELVCRLNLWRMELFKYMKVGQAAVARCRHHTVATRRL